jgi:hypothetical protein
MIVVLRPVLPPLEDGDVGKPMFFSKVVGRTEAVTARTYVITTS